MARLSRPGAGRFLLIVSASLFVVLSGCTEPGDTLDRSATEAQVKAAVVEATGAPIKTVECPEEIPRRTVRPLQCLAMLDGQSEALRVEIQPRSGSAVEVELLDRLVDPAEVAVDMADALEDQLGRPVDVDCGDHGPEVVAVGKWIECDAHDERGLRAVRATLVDQSGTMTFLILN